MMLEEQNCWQVLKLVAIRFYWDDCCV